MTLTQIKYFIHSAKTCNFHQSADELFVSQQTLSKQIRALEKELDFSLFERKKKRLFLTEAGAHLLMVWEPCVAMMEEGIEKARLMTEQKTIKIGIPDIPQVLQTLMPHFQMMASESKEEYIITSINNLVEQFRSGKLDMLVIFRSDVDTFQNEYEVLPLKKMPYGVICNRNHPLAKQEFVRLEDMKEETICCFDTSYVKNMKSHIEEQFARHNIPPNRIKSYADWRNMQIALQRNAGITMTYQCFMPPGDEHLCFRMLDDSEDDPLYYLVAIWKDVSCRNLAYRIQNILAEKEGLC